ncbi:MAG: hypothetical protein J7M14_06180, partial [Planctomycetes bacterium]|nr:hypothetical protein [Planctomycetota bacterium]
MDIITIAGRIQYSLTPLRRRSTRFAYLLFAAVLIPCAGDLAGAAPAAAKPGSISLRPTWSCMGINWPIADEADMSATVTVRYRRKGADWRAAMPLWPHEYKETRMFSGSVVRLAPSTQYEFELTMTKENGQRVVATAVGATLTYPRLPARRVVVPQGGLAEAEKLASPATVMLLGAGTYPAMRLTKPGRPGQWIVYKARGDGEVVIEGKLLIGADYIWLDGISFHSDNTAIEGPQKGICITNCRFKAHYGIHVSDSENYFIADNYIEGDAGQKFSFSGEGVDFGKDSGRC